MKKIKNELFTISVFLCVVLTILSAVLVYYAQSVTIFVIEPSIELGDKVIIEAKGTDINATAITFSGSIIPNRVQKQIVNIKNSKDVLVRAKIEVAGISDIDLSLTTLPIWQKAQDNFYYNKNILFGGVEQTFCSDVSFPESIIKHLVSSNIYNLTVICECLEVSQYNSSVWATSSNEWKENIVNLIENM